MDKSVSFLIKSRYFVALAEAGSKRQYCFSVKNALCNGLAGKLGNFVVYASQHYKKEQ
ncbi:hypothetical protein [Vibrio zhanjiangensis]|uniref:hypothetical protein n=1 Tax=Vibrio zhanjiangensis TaxID=1046128 RepID=UPI0024E0E85D|nr:hypothetical protein [Vibrio zhanjiangensis]